MNVNKDIFENQWEQIRAQSKMWWSLFTDEDLKKVEKAPIKLDKYAMMLRMKYGYSHERVREEINQRINDLNIHLPAFASIGDASVRPEASKATTVPIRRTKKPKSLSDSNIEIE